VKLLVMTAIYPRPDRPEFGSFVRTQVLALQNAGLDVEVLVLDGRNRKLIYPKGIAQLRRRLASDPPALVHAHYSYVGAVASMQRQVPVVLTFHGDDILGTPRADGRIRPASRAIALGGRLLGERLDAVIVQTEEMAVRFRRPDVHVIPHEVDLGTFRPIDRQRARAELGLDAHGHYVLFAASPAIPVKNFPLTARAVEVARRSVPGLELLVVHSEPQSRLALYMNACEVLAFSSWQEGSPNIVKQAMACNMPIVATDVGDVRTMISGTDGCHVVPREVTAFAAALVAETLRVRRTNGRAAVAHLRPELVSERLLNVYDGVLRRRAGARNQPQRNAVSGGAV
jgi:teichuronic acid biosynthesis glycosyltransferase TuaC